MSVGAEWVQRGAERRRLRGGRERNELLATISVDPNVCFRKSMSAECASRSLLEDFPQDRPEQVLAICPHRQPEDSAGDRIPGEMRREMARGPAQQRRMKFKEV